MNILAITSLLSLFLYQNLIPRNPSIIFHQSKETLDTIQKIITSHEKGCYLRFGDGDVNLATGHNDLLQKSNPNLQREMKEAFAINGKNVLKTLPLYCKEFGGLEEFMFPGNHAAPFEWCNEIYNRAVPLWGERVQNVYSHVALHYLACYHPDLTISFLKFLRKNYCIIVCNEEMPHKTLFDIFGPNLIIISTPSSQSYSQIDRIEKACLIELSKNQGYKILITAMGCSGRVLQKRIWYQANQCFLFDFGSLLDALCGWNTRAWIELTKFNENDFLQKLNS